MRNTAASRAALCAVLMIALAASVSAVPKGFTTDFSDACKEAQETGKLIFCYFHLTG